MRRISGQYSSLQAALLVLVIYYVGEFFHNGRGHTVLLKNKHIYIRVYTYFINNISRKSAVFCLSGLALLFFMKIRGWGDNLELVKGGAPPEKPGHLTTYSRKLLTYSLNYIYTLPLTLTL